MCDLPKRGGKKEYDTERMKAIISDSTSMGIETIAFSGGEPLLREDIFTLIQHAKSRGAIAQMATNGLILDMDAAEKLVSSGLDALTISIDGANPEIHDKIRGIKGAFNKAIMATHNIKSAKNKLKGNLILSLSTVIMPDNVDQLPEIVNMAHRLGADNLSFFSAEGIDDNNSLFSAKDREKIIAFLRSLLEKNEKNAIIDNSKASLRALMDKYSGRKPRFTCMAGYTTIFIDCYGDVFPCSMWMNKKIPIGSLKESTLKQLWASEKYKETRKKLLKCHECYYVCHLEINALFDLNLPVH